MEPLRPADSGRTSRKRTKHQPVSGSHPGGFAERIFKVTKQEETHETHELEPPGADEIGADVEALLDEVHSSGQTLLDKRTYTAAQEYRNAIQAFLRRIIPEAVPVETRESSHGILSRKRYTLLGEINRRVDRLISGILQAQSRQLEILSHLQEIEGLLVDLLH